MGLRGSQTAELVFDDCRVPAANLVGEENRGVAVVMSGLDLERVGLSFLILGMAERALELTSSTRRSRRQFGRPISDFQLVQGMVADIYAELESLRSFTYHVGAEINALGSWRSTQSCGQARRSRHLAGRSNLHGDRGQSAPGPRRRRLHLGDRDQPPLPSRQAVGDRSGHDRDPTVDHRAGASGTMMGVHATRTDVQLVVADGVATVTLARAVRAMRSTPRSRGRSAGAFWRRRVGRMSA